jgi:NADH-quinone oxidoreductase subunit K
MNFWADITLNHYLVLSGLLFIIGAAGLLLRRNILIMYMCLEMMLNAAILTLVAFSKFNHNLDVQVMVFFIITVAAAEVAVGLALIVALFRLKQTTHVDDLTTLKF